MALFLNDAVVDRVIRPALRGELCVLGNRFSRALAFRIYAHFDVRLAVIFLARGNTRLERLAKRARDFRGFPSQRVLRLRVDVATDAKSGRIGLQKASLMSSASYPLI